MKKYIWDYTFLLSIAGVVVLLDQYTKSLVRSNLAFHETWAPWPWLLDYVRIVHIENSGAAFGMFQQLSGVFTVLPFIVAGAILYYFPKIPRSDWLIRLALSLQLGGAIGNLIDRLTRKFVTDFVSIGNFAVFNVADAAISVGTAILILGIWLNERKKTASQSESDSESGESPSENVSNPSLDE